MNEKRIWQIIGAGVVVVAAIAILWTYTNKAEAPVQNAREEASQAGTVSFTIDGLYTAKPVPISQNETVLAVLQTLNSEDPAVQLSTKEYSGLGVLVDGIHGQKNGTDKKYWQYKVNGIMPQIGADQYKLKSGDSVEWFFALSQE